MFKRIASWSSKKKLLVGGIILLLIFVFSRKPQVKVETTAVTKGNIVETISASGEIDATQKADLTFQGSGRLAWVGVKEGDTVKKGQAIAKLDTLLLNATYQQAINTYRAYEAAAQKAEDDVKGHSADETYAQKSTRMAAQVARDNAYDAMKSAEQSLKFATITAPFAGVITKTDPAFAGSNVTYLSAVYSLVNPETLFFNTEVGETDIAKIKVGQKVNLSLDAFPEKTLTGEVIEIGLASVTTSTGGTAYKVKISLPMEGLDYRLGMNGDAEIVISTLEDVLAVSSDAIVEDGETFVWTIAGGKAKKALIELGAEGFDQTEVKRGLTEGEMVILRPPTMLKSGTKVKI